MDSIIAQHSRRQTFLIFYDVKHYFNYLKNQLFFLNKSIYGRESVINLNGKREGLQIEYHNSGEKRFETKWKDGKREGLEIGYYNSGEKEYEMNWKNDKQEGLHVIYSKSGKKINERFFQGRGE